MATDTGPLFFLGESEREEKQKVKKYTPMEIEKGGREEQVDNTLTHTDVPRLIFFWGWMRWMRCVSPRGRGNLIITSTSAGLRRDIITCSIDDWEALLQEIQRKGGMQALALLRRPAAVEVGDALCCANATMPRHRPPPQELERMQQCPLARPPSFLRLANSTVDLVNFKGRQEQNRPACHARPRGAAAGSKWVCRLYVQADLGSR